MDVQPFHNSVLATIDLFLRVLAEHAPSARQVQPAQKLCTEWAPEASFCKLCVRQTFCPSYTTEDCTHETAAFACAVRVRGLETAVRSVTNVMRSPVARLERLRRIVSYGVWRVTQHYVSSDSQSLSQFAWRLTRTNRVDKTET